LSAVGAKTNGRRTAFSYLSSNVAGVVVFGILYYVITAIVSLPFTDNIMNPFSIALANTIYRLIVVLLLAPFMGLLEKLVNVLIKGKTRKKKTERQGHQHLEDRFIAYPALALEQTYNVICDMAKEAGKAVQMASGLIGNYDEETAEQVLELEKSGDAYEDELGSYLMKLSAKELTPQQGRYASVYLHSLSDFERISDHARNITENATELKTKNLTFSDSALHELSVMEAAVKEIMNITLDAFIQENVSEAKKVEPLEEVIDDLSDEMKMRHIDRLQHGHCTIANGFVFNDLITNFERISDHCSNIALAIIEMHANSFAGHEYIGAIKSRHQPDFEKTYLEYSRKFTLKDAEQKITDDNEKSLSELQ